MTGVKRRAVLRGAAGATALGVAGTAAGPAVAAPPSTFDGWLEGVDNYDGVVDERGKSVVTVDVGVGANGGPYGFGPAAVQVDPGATVTWRWTGDGSHNVVADDGSFRSEYYDEAGATFERTVESGVHRYACEPHAAMGMRGVVVAGSVPAAASAAGSSEATEPTDYGDWFDDVGNFEGTVDEREADTVTVRVGAQGNGGNFAFDPPAVRISPGTTVRWELVDGVHDVAAADGSFGSDVLDEPGTTFERTFDDQGVVRYACTPHRALGMKGALVVGTPSAGGPGLRESDLVLGGLVAAALSPVGFWALVNLLGTGDERLGDNRRPAGR